jgi:hypothetical protein
MNRKKIFYAGIQSKINYKICMNLQKKTFNLLKSSRDQSFKSRLNQTANTSNYIDANVDGAHVQQIIFKRLFKCQSQTHFNFTNVINFPIGFRFSFFSFFQRQMRNYKKKILRKSRLLNLIFISQQGVTFWKALCQYPLNQFQTKGSGVFQLFKNFLSHISV